MGSDAPPRSPEETDKAPRAGRAAVFTVPDDLVATDAGAALTTALGQFDAGDYAGMGTTLAPLLSHDDERVRALADTLAGRLRVDPMQMGVIAACVAFLGIIVYRYFL